MEDEEGRSRALRADDAEPDPAAGDVDVALAGVAVGSGYGDVRSVGRPVRHDAEREQHRCGCEHKK